MAGANLDALHPVAVRTTSVDGEQKEKWQREAVKTSGL